MSEYCLRWNNHRPNLVTVFSELLTSEALVDVTLATDGHYIRAHKLVLSACSIYFKDLFASSPCKHPIVILKDISIEALKTVIDFIYRGEVTVSQDKLQEVLRTAESLRIKGLTDNPRSYDELPSHGLRNASSSFSSQATRQRSSLTDSRDQSLSLEGEEDGEPGTPPSSKKRKIASEHDSLESSQDDAETEENNRLADIKPEPSEDRDNERSLSRETESEYNVGASLENAEEAGGAAGPSDSATPQHAQGRGGKRGLLQRQQGIIKDAAVEERREENQNGNTQQLQFLESTRVSADNSSSSTSNVVTASVNATTTNSITSRISGAIVKAEAQQPEVIIPDTVVVTGSVPQPALLQVPAVMVGGPREALAPTPPPLPKTHSIPTPLLAPAPLSKQASQPEFRGPPTHQGPPALSKQRSHPGVLNYTPAHSIERVPSNSSNTLTQQQQQQQQHHHLQQQQQQQQQQQASASQQHLQVIPMQAVFVKQRSSPILSSISPQQLRPIQPKPSDGIADIIKIKDVPTIRVMPSEDVGPGGGGGAPPQIQRALSEEPSPYRSPGTTDQLVPGPSVLVQSVSQDSGLDNRAEQYRIASPQLNPSIHNPPIRPPSSTPLHCPALRTGPALGCNFCWNSTDTQGRVLRRKTKYHCPECRTNLCIVPCFHEYHKQMERAQDTQKQITKILTKTASM